MGDPGGSRGGMSLLWPSTPLCKTSDPMAPNPHPQTFVQAVPSTEATLASALPHPIWEGWLKRHPLREDCSGPRAPLSLLHTRITCSCLCHANGGRPLEV